jgi:hypothetical protein
MTEDIQQIEQKESIALSTTAKGLIQLEIKVRDSQLNDTTLERLDNIYQKLLLKYPNNVVTASKTE